MDPVLYVRSKLFPYNLQRSRALHMLALTREGALFNLRPTSFPVQHPRRLQSVWQSRNRETFRGKWSAGFCCESLRPSVFYSLRPLAIREATSLETLPLRLIRCLHRNCQVSALIFHTPRDSFTAIRLAGQLWAKRWYLTFSVAGDFKVSGVCNGCQPTMLFAVVF